MTRITLQNSFYPQRGTLSLFRAIQDDIKVTFNKALFWYLLTNRVFTVFTFESKPGRVRFGTQYHRFTILKLLVIICHMQGASW